MIKLCNAIEKLFIGLTETKVIEYNLDGNITIMAGEIGDLKPFCLFVYFLVVFKHFLLSILMVIISLELTRVNPDRNMFSINVELTSTFFLLYRGLVHHHHRFLNLKKSMV